MERYSEVTPPYSTYMCGGQFNKSFLHIWKITSFSGIYHITLNYGIVIFINPGFLCCIVKTSNLYCENGFYWIRLQAVHLEVLMSIWTQLFPVHVTACLTSLPINFKIMLKFNELEIPKTIGLHYIPKEIDFSRVLLVNTKNLIISGALYQFVPVLFETIDWWVQLVSKFVL